MSARKQGFAYALPSLWLVGMRSYISKDAMMDSISSLLPCSRLGGGGDAIDPIDGSPKQAPFL